MMSVPNYIPAVATINQLTSPSNLTGIDPSDIACLYAGKYISTYGEFICNVAIGIERILLIALERCDRNGVHLDQCDCVFLNFTCGSQVSIDHLETISVFFNKRVDTVRLDLLGANVSSNLSPDQIKISIVGLSNRDCRENIAMTPMHDGISNKESLK